MLKKKAYCINAYEEANITSYMGQSYADESGWSWGAEPVTFLSEEAALDPADHCAAGPESNPACMCAHVRACVCARGGDASRLFRPTFGEERTNSRKSVFFLLQKINGDRWSMQASQAAVAQALICTEREVDWTCRQLRYLQGKKRFIMFNEALYNGCRDLH